jgi:thioredoxin-like negative regulator of GroEL
MLAALATLALAAAPAAAAATPTAPPVFENDFPAALAAARRLRAPLLVDLWAPGCAPCREVRATVLPDERVAAGKHVRLELDVDRPENADLLGRFTWQGLLPTFYVVEPRSQVVVLRSSGRTATAPDVARLVADGQRLVRRATGADALAGKAARAAAEKRWDDAAGLYAQALEKGGDRWPSRERTASDLVLMLSGADPAACAREATRLLPALSPGPARAGVAAVGLDACALALPPGAPARDVVPQLERATAAALDDPGLLAETRAALHEALCDAREDARDETGLREAGARAWAFLARAWDEAPSPAARAALAAHLGPAAAAAGEPGRAVPLLEALAADLPDDFDVHLRLARAYRQAGRGEDAAAAVARGLDAAYGPARAYALKLRADLAAERGDAAAQRAALAEAVAYADRLPSKMLEARDRRRLGQLRAELARLDAAR